MLTRTASLQSWQSVDWANPVNWRDPLTKGLKYWQLSVPHRGGGTQALDLVSRRVGTRTNMASPSTSTSGQGTTMRPGGWGEERLDGSAGYLFVTSAEIFNTTSLTVCAWIKPTAFANYRNVFSKLSDDTNAEQFGLLVDSAGAVQWQLGTSTTFLGALALHQWAFLCGTSDGVTGTLYAGTLTTPVMVLGTVTSAPFAYNGAYAFRIGNTLYGSNSRYFQGAIDNVMFFNRCLSPRAVQEVYTDSRAYHPRMLRHLGVPMAGVASGFQPAWAAWANQAPHGGGVLV